MKKSDSPVAPRPPDCKREKKSGVYLDAAAATPVDDEVRAAMEPFLQDHFANPSSSHTPGRLAAAAVDTARATIAELLDCTPREIIFTSGGSESTNLAIFGNTKTWRSRHHGDGDGEIITSTIEHDAVRAPCQLLAREGIRVHEVLVEPNGIIHPANVTAALNTATRFVTIMTANNEIGTIQPMREIVRVVKKRNPDIIVHTDACQAALFCDVRPDTLGVDMLSISASKMYGPKGVGALYLRRGVPLAPMIIGGGQEQGLRSGTESVVQIVGFAKAFALTVARRPRDNEKMIPLRDRLMDGILSIIPGTKLNGDRHKRLPNNVNIFFPHVDGELLLAHFDDAGIFVSLGSACATQALDPSHVLLALGYAKKEARQCVRFTLTRTTTKEEIDTVLHTLPRIMRKLQQK